MAARRAGPLLVLALLMLAPAAGATPAQLAGTVFEDANGNGTRDAGEPGVAGVAVSNGRDIIRSGDDGSYMIATSAGDVVFAIKPSDRAFARRADGLPAFWRLAGEDDASANPTFDIALSPRRESRDPLQVLLFTDPQVGSLVEVDYYFDDIVAPLAGTDAALGMTMGDLVDDAPALYPALNAVTASLGVPWLHIAGNHDDVAAFRTTYGPDTIAWEEPPATFIGLNDVVALPGQQPSYAGGLREDQFAFLAAYLPSVRKDRLLVVAAHIPFFQIHAADRERLFALLRDFPHVLLLSGHTHNQMHVFHDAGDGWHGAKPLHEYNIGAACGAFWSGVKDADGVPDSTMSDGTPNGHARLTVAADGEYKLAWHNARDPADSQIGLHAPRVLRQGAYPAFGVYANIYIGMDDSQVEYRIDDGDWQPMRKVLQPDPRLLAENARDDAATELRGYDRSPEASVSQHLWRGTLPTDLDLGEHVIEVRYLDPWRGEQRAKTTYRLAEAPP